MEDGVERDALLARKAELERRLKARTDQPGYRQNCIALKIRIAEIEKELNPE